MTYQAKTEQMQETKDKPVIINECPRCGSNNWEFRGVMDGEAVFRCEKCRYFAALGDF